jgi:hypothetical protein
VTVACVSFASPRFARVLAVMCELGTDMTDENTPKNLGRRGFLRRTGTAAAALGGFTLLPSSVQKALAIPAARVSR